jgi:hypothetical protein
LHDIHHLWNKVDRILESDGKTVALRFLCHELDIVDICALVVSETVLITVLSEVSYEIVV